MGADENWDDSEEGGGGKKWWIVMIAVAVLAVTAAFLRIDSVMIEGSRHYTAGQFEEMLFPGAIDRNPLLFLIRESTGNSIVVPFVDRYSVEMKGLSEVHIIVYEKEIAGYVDYLGSYVYFDRDGMVVEKTLEATEDVPRILGLAGGVIEVGERLPVDNEAVFQAVLSIGQFFRSHEVDWGEERVTLSELVDAVHVDTYANATCIMGDLQIYLGGTKNLEEKLLIMTDMLPRLYGRNGTVYLDNYSEAQVNPSFVLKEGQKRIDPDQESADTFETEPAPVPETPAATAAAPETTPQAGAETGTQAAGTEQEGADMEIIDIPVGTQAPPVDGDGVDDIPDDYVGGDGYGR